ncbi:AAA family ATPase [Psychrobacter sp. CAM01]|uniref:ATP-dependent nuclease n=1 Tax=Psychrobacter sp. CAM01 TaxID=3080335 RepID=UPI0029364D9B|nr:AAA family ATPase [Psychrobacter sp. CAM01]MDV2859698.1 AAA family ATPase [Psychrobacter sp. CAM01]
MKYKLKEFSINNYRSILKLKIQPSEDNFLTICGINNVGKTNFLRALNLFFNPFKENFSVQDDVPYHIVEATRGSGYKITLTAKIQELETGDILSIKQVFSELKGEKTIAITGSKANTKLSSKDIINFLTSKFKFFFIEASNVDIPKLISEIVNDEILPLSLDKRRSKGQLESLDKLEGFIEQSKSVVSRIETDLTKILLELLNDVESIDTKNWKLKINFPEYNYLREAISNMIAFTLFDTNEKPLETKGSGIQRTVLLSLIKYVNDKIKNKDVIWAIDEPEAFLQASLQKSLYSQFLHESQKSQIIITTHSQFFIDVNRLENTYLFESSIDSKPYARKGNKIYQRLDTDIFEGSDFERAERIKHNFGLSRNDTWDIMPFNVLVEGLEDKDYLISLLNIYSLPVPNILTAGGTSKFSGYLQFINDYCQDLPYKPVVLALYDKDSAGRSEYNSLDSPKKKSNLSNIELRNTFVVNSRGSSPDNIEIEDLVPDDVIIDAANKIIRKQGFSIIKAKDRRTRLKPIYINKPVLEFLNEMARNNNTDKNYEIRFDTLANKLMLSKDICKMLKTDEKSKQIVAENTEVKDWLKSIIDYQL